jgi:exonuclease III
MIEQLSIFNWNIRGLNSPARREAIRDLIQSATPKLVCLQERKLALITPQTATEVLGHQFNDFKYLPAMGTRGGITLGWHTDFIEASSLVLWRFSLSITIRPTWMATPFRLTVVYSPSEDAEKSEFLDKLLSITPSSPM